MRLVWAEDNELEPAVRQALTGPGAAFELVDTEVLGSTVRVFAQRARSVNEWLAASGSQFGDGAFMIFPERTLTYDSLLASVLPVAAALRDEYGVRKGDRVAICSANVPGHPIVAWSAAWLGAVVSELNGWWTGPEILHGIDLTEPTVVFGDRRRLDRLQGLNVKAPLVCFEDDFQTLESHAPLDADWRADVEEDDPLVVLFTSGTTGRPKGATLTHRAHVHMMMQATLQFAKRAMLLGQPLPTGPRVTVGISPMFHVSGFTTQIIAGPFSGGTWVYPPPGRFDERQVFELTERYRANSWALVPTQLWRLLEHPDFDRYDLSSLTWTGGGGSTFQPELWRAVRERFGGRVGMSTGYGMSETCGAGTHMDAEEADSHPDAVGRPGPGIEIEVRDPDGRALGEGEVGEICLRGATTLRSYWGDPEATAKALDAERWYRTGEFGHISAGLLFLDSRGSDLIIRGGENIYPIEIENRLIEHPDIAEVAVVGVEHRTLGQEVAAFVVRAPGSTLEASEVQRWVSEGLAPFKVPTIVTFIESLPHNAVGKVMKHLIGKPANLVEE